MVLSFVFGVSGLPARSTPPSCSTPLPRSWAAPYALAMLPVALTSFGYHHSVASMRAYYGEEQKARQAILGGP
jgi:tryptophan-specific transport protein